MAIGFPAYHTDVVSYELKDEDLLALVHTTVESLNWKITDDEGLYLIGKTINGAMSFGERIYIEIKGSKVGFRSESVIPTQFIDFGKNRKNVEMFFAALGTFVLSTSKKH